MKFDFGDKTKAFKKGLQFEADDNFIYTKANGYSFCLNNKGYVIFSGRKNGLNGKYLHRVLMDAVNGLIDHADGNPLNNCRANLRVATKSQNNQNRTKQSNNTSGYKNVNWSKKSKKWRVDIDCKSYGLFATAELANEHAILKRHELHGAFARG